MRFKDDDSDENQTDRTTPLNPLTLSDLEDHFLVARAIDGDPLAFLEITRRYAAIMRAYANRFTKNLADADDVVQESLTSAWQNLASLNNPKSLKTWLFKITARKAIDLVRARKTYTDLTQLEITAASTNDPQTQMVVKEEIADLSKAVDSLPDAQRQVWLLREIGGLSYVEIGHELGISATAVRGRLARARETLIEVLEGRDAS